MVSFGCPLYSLIFVWLFFQRLPPFFGTFQYFSQTRYSRPWSNFLPPRLMKVTTTLPPHNFPPIFFSIESLNQTMFRAPWSSYPAFPLTVPCELPTLLFPPSRWRQFAHISLSFSQLLLVLLVVVAPSSWGDALSFSLSAYCYFLSPRNSTPAPTFFFTFHDYLKFCSSTTP